MGFLKSLLYSQLFGTPTYPTHDCTGQTIIVTGSNVGLGLEAARHFARLNCAKLILAVRTASKGEKAKESILASTKRTSDCVEVWNLDLGSSASVKAFAKRVEALERVDVVLENAGVSPFRFSASEGTETTIQVNVINTLLLAVLLLPKLKQSAQKFQTTPHLTIVTSEMHALAKFVERDADDIYESFKDPKTFDAGQRYSTSKLIEIMFVRELAKSVSVPPVVDTVNPGFVMRFLLARTTEVGSRTLVAAACAGADSHGRYMSDGVNAAHVSWLDTADGLRLQKKVYDQTLAILEKIEPGISKNI